VEGKADYNIKKLSPQVDYDVHGDTGELDIQHKGFTKLGISYIKNTWAIQLNDSITMDLTVETVAPPANLD
uniref:toast rack family protein n=1 Tax=Bacillus cereus TaxID=1396 RepID=UPI0020C16223